MSHVLSIFSVTSECVRGNFPRRMNHLLRGIGAKITERPLPEEYQLPWRATHECHRFKWRGLNHGWVDIIRKEGKFIQVVISLRYSKIPLLSRRARDWKRLNATAASLFTQQQRFRVGNKAGNLYQDDKVKTLITNFQDNRHAYIEIKIARDYFCS